MGASVPSCYDAVIVGSGPNGLAAAITLAKKGLSTVVIEAKSTIGGGMRSEALTLPGFIHDVCSSVHPLAVSSPFLQSLPLDVKWIEPEFSLSHPFNDGTSLDVQRGKLLSDKGYRLLFEPFVDAWDHLAKDVLAPLHFPKNLWLMMRLAYYGFRSAEGLATALFTDDKTKSLFAGLAAHSILPLDKMLTAAFGIIMGTTAHSVGWPFVQGGTGELARALASHYLSLSGEIRTDVQIKSLEELPKHKVVLFDVGPKELLAICKNHLPESYRKKLEKYRYGPGVFKMDFALDAPIPWKNSNLLKAGTIHLGGTMDEIAYSEKLVWKGKVSENPFTILVQPSLFDSTRAPPGKHTAWAYCHVPNNASIDMTDVIENQIEKLAPGFKDCILAKSVKTAPHMELYNPNYVGGDINGGSSDLFQLFTRPVARLNPYATDVPGIYICSSSTPPGGGVHGMCGYYAAKSALKECLSENSPHKKNRSIGI